MSTLNRVVIAPEIRNDERTVCIFCGSEAYSDYGYHCGEYGAIMSRAEYYEYTGEDYFSDEN